MDVSLEDVGQTNFGSTKPEDVHRVILMDAAEYANLLAVTDERLPEVVGGGPFSPAPERSRRGGLALAIDPGLIDGLLKKRAGHKKVEILHQIGTEAVRQAILDNPDLFGGLIVGHAKQGVNYFDRFGVPGDQARLF